MSGFLSRPVSSLGGVGPKRSSLIENLGASSVGGLLWIFPRRYEDRKRITAIKDLVPGRASTVTASVTGVACKRLAHPGHSLLQCGISDGTGQARAVWFNRRGLERLLTDGTDIIFYGVPSMRGSMLEFINPDFEVLNGGNSAADFAGIYPIYPSTEGLPAKWFAKLMQNVLREAIPLITETLPEEIIKKRKLISLAGALRAMHAPRSEREWKDARTRLAYEELLVFQTAMALRREKFKNQAQCAVISNDGPIYKKFRASVPFPLTRSQEEALDDIFADLALPHPMSRLLQGDVGSGKTLLALAAAAAAADYGVQTVLMAPTEILARQLHAEAEKYLSPLGVKPVLIIGGQSAGKRREVLAAAASGKAGVIAGTHALIEDGVRFNKLGLVIIDEQHRFGVGQRAAMMNRTPPPNVLMMSATPIPRTLTLTFFGDLDISELREKPAGRRKVETRLIGMPKMGTLLQFIIDEAAAGGRIYWVCPRIDEDGTLTAASAEKRERFLKKHLDALGVGIVHGRMSGPEKEEAINRFKNGDIKILVGTTVVEVGVNVPEASVMVVESPERFGMAQLHQLRGRVGRGSRRGVCIMLTNAEGASERLNVLLETDDGFAIAEADMARRGAGELGGFIQHGISDFKIADLEKDMHLLAEAREDAAELAASMAKLLACPAFMEKVSAAFIKAAGVG